MQIQSGKTSSTFRNKQKRRKRFSRNAFIICTILMLATIISSILILNQLGVITGPWTLILTIIMSVIGLILGIFQAFPSLLKFSDQNETVSPPPSTAVKSQTGTQHIDTSHGQASGHTQPQPKDFLISYTDADASAAEWVAAQLESDGYSTILRLWDVQPGSNAMIELNKATREAQRTILIVSPHYLSRFDEHPEWTVAFQQDLSGEQRKVLPVYVANCNDQLKGLLGSLVPMSLVGMNENTARETLLQGVSGKSKRLRGFPPFPLQQ